MGIEIERKFLVKGDSWRDTPWTEIRQGYLSRDKRRTVRVRIAGDRAYLTVKGLTKGAVRLEFEYEIPVADAQELLALCAPPLIEKRRHVVEYCGSRWEVDEFIGAHAGLVLAEIELSDPAESFEQPDWLGEEVTGDPRYFNSTLGSRRRTDGTGAINMHRELPTNSRAALPPSSSGDTSSAAKEPYFLPGETGKELDAGRMVDSSAAVEAEERRLGRRLTLVERQDVVSPIYR